MTRTIVLWLVSLVLLAGSASLAETPRERAERERAYRAAVDRVMERKAPARRAHPPHSGGARDSEAQPDETSKEVEGFDRRREPAR